MKLKTCLGAFLALSFCYADVRLPSVIGDHMLLQRDMPVRIFGKAAPAESVSVSFRGQNVQATTDALGRWEVWLAPMKPAAAADMTIKGANEIKVSQVADQLALSQIEHL